MPKLLTQSQIDRFWQDGFLAPIRVMPESEALDYRRRLERFETSTGADMPYPTVNDTSNVGELLAENAATSSLDVTIASTTFKSYVYSSKLIPIYSSLSARLRCVSRPVFALMRLNSYGCIRYTNFVRVRMGVIEPHQQCCCGQ